MRGNTFSPSLLGFSAKRNKVHTFHRTLHTSPTNRASILFALQGLSNSRETQHFNKLSRLSRVEHSPSLKLIQTSEIEAYPLPSQPKPQPAVVPLNPRGARHDPVAYARYWDARALHVGRAVLAQNAQHAARLGRQVRRAKREQVRQAAVMERDRSFWRQETRRLRNEMRVAGVWIVTTIGAATILASWRFWPQKMAPDSALLASSLAEAADSLSATRPAPAVVAESVSTLTPTADQPSTAEASRSSSWWRGLFWKQQ
nr:hypothetical protein CFP56_04636 [Quercus suber]